MVVSLIKIDCIMQLVLNFFDIIGDFCILRCAWLVRRRQITRNWLLLNQTHVEPGFLNKTLLSFSSVTTSFPVFSNPNQ